MQFNQIMEENSKPKQTYGQVVMLHNINKKLDSIMEMLHEQRLRTEHLSTRISKLEGDQPDQLTSKIVKRLP